MQHRISWVQRENAIFFIANRNIIVLPNVKRKQRLSVNQVIDQHYSKKVMKVLIVVNETDYHNFPGIIPSSLKKDASCHFKVLAISHLMCLNSLQIFINRKSTMDWSKLRG